MSTLNRLARIGTLALLVGAVSGCCVLPSRGWGHHGSRGYDRHESGGTTYGQAPHQRSPRDGGGRWGR